MGWAASELVLSRTCSLHDKRKNLLGYACGEMVHVGAHEPTEEASPHQSMQEYRICHAGSTKLEKNSYRYFSRSS